MASAFKFDEGAEPNNASLDACCTTGVNKSRLVVQFNEETGELYIRDRSNPYFSVRTSLPLRKHWPVTHAQLLVRTLDNGLGPSFAPVVVNAQISSTGILETFDPFGAIKIYCQIPRPPEPEPEPEPAAELSPPLQLQSLRCMEDLSTPPGSPSTFQWKSFYELHGPDENSEYSSAQDVQEVFPDPELEEAGGIALSEASNPAMFGEYMRNLDRQQRLEAVENALADAIGVVRSLADTVKTMSATCANVQMRLIKLEERADRKKRRKLQE